MAYFGVGAFNRNENENENKQRSVADDSNVAWLPMNEIPRFFYSF